MISANSAGANIEQEVDFGRACARKRFAQIFFAMNKVSGYKHL
jgi:hypothetical protein